MKKLFQKVFINYWFYGFLIIIFLKWNRLKFIDYLNLRINAFQFYNLSKKVTWINWFESQIWTPLSVTEPVANILLLNTAIAFKGYVYVITVSIFKNKILNNEKN